MPSTKALPTPVSVGELSRIADAPPVQNRVTARAAVEGINDLLRNAARNDHAIGESGFRAVFPSAGDTMSESLAKKVEKHFETTNGYNVEAVDQDHISGGSSGWVLKVSWWPSK